MPRLLFSSALPAAPADAFAWHARPGALPRLIAPWSDTEVVHFEGLHDGATTVLKVDAGLPYRPSWTSRHEGYVEGETFEDRQVDGPFAAWHHVHRFDPDGAGGTRYVDDIAYALPLAPLSDLVAAPLLAPLGDEFAYRHRTVRDDLAMHARYALPPLRIAITGASGLIGTALRHVLTTGGHTVLRLVRGAAKGPDEVAWDVEAGTIDAARLDGLDAVVHLAGEPVFAPRWTDEKKRRIYASRIDGTALLARTLAALPRPPRAFLAASAIGIYGDRGDEALPETAAPAASGFLPHVVKDWEAATRAAEDAGIRTVHLRTGIVLSPRGGALAQMLPAFRLGVGGPIGDAGTYLPWIGLDDTVGAYVHALATESLSGPVNLAAPEPTTMGVLADTLARVLHRPSVLAVPGPLLSALGGEAAREMLLASARVVPARLMDTGYAFRHGGLETALRHLLGRPRDGVAFPNV